MSEIVQKSPEWYAIRLGKVTASRVSDVIAKTKTGWGASRSNYAAQLIAERLTGTPADSYTNAAMQWGTDHEAEARLNYEFDADVEVTEVGFVAHPTIAMAGASPDGLVGDDGLVEIKCPSTATHLDTLLRGYIDEKYINQMHWQMACTGRRWCDFVSFDPRLPEHMRLYVWRIERDERIVGPLEKAVSDFLAEIDEKMAELGRLYPIKVAA